MHLPLNVAVKVEAVLEHGVADVALVDALPHAPRLKVHLGRGEVYAHDLNGLAKLEQILFINGREPLNAKMMKKDKADGLTQESIWSCLHLYESPYDLLQIGCSKSDGNMILCIIRK
jgi:hypothetical protein